MSTLAIFIIGILTTSLCALFVVITITELKKLGRQAEEKLNR